MSFASPITLALATIVGFGIAPAVLAREGLRRFATVFAAGILLGLLIAHLLPEVFVLAPHLAPPLLLAGFAAMMLIQQRVLRTDPCCSHEHLPHAGLSALAALGLCATNDGVLLGGDTGGDGLANPLLWGLAVHKVVAAFAFATLLQNLTPVPPRSRQILYGIVFVAISPVAYAATSLLTGWTTAIAAATAIASGALLYVLVSGLLPQVEHHARHAFGTTFAAFTLALAASAGLQFALPHDHGGHEAHDPGGHEHGGHHDHTVEPGHPNHDHSPTGG